MLHDWASKAAQHIYDELPRIRNRPRVERIAAIIATYAEPLVVLLLESKREHGYDEDGDPCDWWNYIVNEGEEHKACTCGAAAWNARIDAALSGSSIKT
jgi:hypothetical protein